MSQGYRTGICTKETVKRTGLNVWATGRGDNGPDVDIIAVQGLGSHPYYTWVAKTTLAEQVKPTKSHRWSVVRRRPKNTQAGEIGDVGSTPSVTTEIMWLRDLLPDLIPSARIATYSYESDWRRTSIKTTLRKCGEQLLNVLRQQRSSQKERQRPLIFIGHSLGGLVIKQALLLADHGHEFQDIRQSTAGIIFLGAPHQGSDAAVYGVWLAEAMRHDKTLLECLKKNSPDLYDIARDFETSHGDTDVICFYESKDASYGPCRTQFADYQSAALLGKMAISLNTDHSGLNKFDGPEDENFLMVLPEIQRMVQAAPQKVEERYRAQVAITENRSFHVDFSLKGIPVVERFVGRDKEMARIAKVLLPSLTSQMRRKVFIIHGLGGVGKTQLSVEYARNYHENYSAVLWIDGSTKERVRRSIADLASQLPQHQLSEKSREYLQNKSSNVDEIVEGVLNWLSRPSNDQWLLVFDNVDREYTVPSEAPEAFDVKDYFPTAEQGSILITSRLASLWELGAEDMKLRPVDELQGKSILENSTGRAEEGSLELVALLQGLPLALNQAGSYMRKTGTTATEYIGLYEQEWSRLMAEQQSFALRENTNRSVLTTWSLSFVSLRFRSDAAANFLMLCSFLDGQDLWYELFQPTLNPPLVDEVPPWLVDCIGDKIDFNKCVGLLLEYSFIDAKSKTSSFSIHSVLHSWCFHQSEAVMTSMGRLALMVVTSAAQRKTYLSTFLADRRLLPHCDRVCPTLQWLLQDVFQNEEDVVHLSTASLRLVRLYEQQNRAEDAEKICMLVLPVFEKFRGHDHKYLPGLANVFDNALGTVYLGQGKDKEAEEVFLRVLGEQQTYQGLNYAMAHGPLPMLAILYSKQGRMKEAENMYLRSLAAREEILGFEDSSTLDAVRTLGNFYVMQGRTKEAEDMFLRVLIGLEKAPSPDPGRLLRVISDLGFLYSKDPCKMKEAEEMYLRALSGYKRIHDSEHINAMKTERKLGNLYSRNPCKIREAEDMYLEALAGFEKIHGPQHVDVAITKCCLGALYSENPCKIKEAEEMYLEALASYKKIYGLEHEDVINTKFSLGILYSKDLCKTKETEEMFLGALAGYEKIYGSADNNVMKTRFTLGTLYLKDPCKMKEGEDMLLRALDGSQRIHDLEHYLVVGTENALAVFYHNHGRWKEAEGRYLSALDESLRCSAHEEAFAIRNSLGCLFNQQSMFEKAMQQFELALEGYTNLWGPDHEKVIHTLVFVKICRQQLEVEKVMSNLVPEDRNSVSESRRLSAP